MSVLQDPKAAQAFHFVRCTFDAALGEAQLVYAFDAGPEMVESVRFPGAPFDIPAERSAALDAALKRLHLIAGVSYYKAGVPPKIALDSYGIDRATAELMREIYTEGLAEFAYQNRLDLSGRVNFPADAAEAAAAPTLGLPRRSLVPLGGGKDSLVSVELLRAANEPMAVVWVGTSALIAACAEASALPKLNIGRQLAPLLFEYNRIGAYNGHIPVTAINSAILVFAALLLGYDSIAFSNERSASSATLEQDGVAVNHQWSKSLTFERAFHRHVNTHIAADLDYFSVLRPWSELAVTKRFATLDAYHGVFSSCNRNFRILGERPAARWCGECPKCHFVFLALAPFMSKPRLLSIFGQNLLDRIELAPKFDALLEYRDHKPFECVGEARESRAALAALAARAEWREDAIVARYVDEILPSLPAADLDLATLLQPAAEHLLPPRLQAIFDAPGRA